MSRPEDFEAWLAHLDDFLEAFRAGAPDAVRPRLDGSPESVAAMEELLLARFADKAAILSPTAAREANGFAVYLGELFRRHGGGRWDLQSGDPSHAYDGKPVVRFERGAAVCPLFLVTAAVSRRRPGYLGSVLAARTDVSRET